VLKAYSGTHPTRLNSVNQTLKIATKLLLRNENAVLLMKAAKIALDARLDRTYDRIIPLFPLILDTTTPVIIDVGANMGQFAARLSRQFSAGQIHCFEPVHGNAVGLQRTKRWLRLDNVTISEEALCDRIGVEAIHIPVFNGTYRDGALAVLETSKKSYNNVTYHVETVRTNTIDAVATALGIDRLDLIKIDTEGAEDRVVKGGLNTIDKFLPILYLETPLHQQWLSSLYERGYRPFYNDGISLYAPRDAEHQTNVLLIHQSKSNRAVSAGGASGGSGT
jgi:FkbM family methyltransferase